MLEYNLESLSLKMDVKDDLEKQIIGRGQRLGRTSTLNVNYLCYQNEL